MSATKVFLSDKKGLSGKREKKALLTDALYFCAAFLFCGFSVGGELSPFGISFAACLPYGSLYAGIPGCALGYAVSLGNADMLRYWGALAFCSTLRAVLRRRLGEKRSCRLAPLLSSVSVLLGTGIYKAVTGSGAEGAALAFVEAAAALCAGVFFARSLVLLGIKSKLSAMTVQDKLVLSCSGGLFLLCASGFTVMGIAPARVLAFVGVMLIAFCKGAGAACAVGAVAGAFLSIGQGFSCLLPAMTMGGIASGTVAFIGQAGSAAAFSLALTVTAALQGRGESFFVIFAEALIAFGFFSLMPAELMSRIKEQLRKRGFVRDDRTGRIAAYDLKRASCNIYQICDMISTANEERSGTERRDEGEDAVFAARNAEMQRVLTDQFRGIGDFLSELSLRINETRLYDSSESAAVKAALRDEGIYADMLGVFYDGNGSASVEITLAERPADIDWRKAKAIIERMTGRSFERPELEASQLQTVLIFFQKRPYRIQIGFSKASAREGEPCGDSVSAATAVDGRGFALICDGMGTGYQAATDSSLTARIIKKLVCSGFSFDGAMRIVNSALIARSDREALVTVDGAEVNLFTGETVIYKAGAALSIIRKGDKAVVLERSSMPLGILRSIKGSKTRFTGEAGDIILLLSDGVTQGDCGWIRDELLSWSTNSMDQLSMHILKLARLRGDKKSPDDMTVVAVKIEADLQ